MSSTELAVSRKIIKEQQLEQVANNSAILQPIGSCENSFVTSQSNALDEIELDELLTLPELATEPAIIVQSKPEMLTQYPTEVLKLSKIPVKDKVFDGAQEDSDDSRSVNILSTSANDETFLSKRPSMVGFTFSVNQNTSIETIEKNFLYNSNIPASVKKILLQEKFDQSKKLLSSFL